MFALFDSFFFRVNADVATLAPLLAKYGFGGISVPAELLENKEKAREASKIVYDNGLQWGLLPTPLDTYAEQTDDTLFEENLKKYALWAETGEIMGVRRSYNHVLPGSNLRAFDENYEWHVKRARRVNRIMEDHGIQYGLEFIGPRPLVKSFRYPFVDSISGVLSIADAVSDKMGYLFDTYHWYCNGGRMDDLYYAAQHTDRMVCFHINDGIAGKTREEQEDLTRALPMTTGVIDALTPYRLFRMRGYSGPVMCEPIFPLYYELEKMEPEEAVRTMWQAHQRMKDLEQERKDRTL